MIEEVATVVAVGEGGVEVACFGKSACGQCRQSSHCGTGLVAKALPGREHRFFIATELRLKVGEQVRIGIPEHSLVTSALLVYLLPLLLLLGGALLTSLVLGMGDGGTLAGAAIGGSAGFILASRLSRRGGRALSEPVLIGPLLPVTKID
ncbi:SoxR reducing system RseC family protein [Zobellella sp. DQSA1]|uniref:SoxR reducing system RseC family protein n=1 Tax=Zobellella sp. DQSA1 TaxID=3342386 RepID=UPI0035C0E89F